jgi:hypothetical protein
MGTALRCPCSMMFAHPSLRPGHDGNNVYEGLE